MALTPEQEKLLDEQEASSMGPLDYLKDWAMSIPAGVRAGAESWPGMGGDVFDTLGAAALVSERFAGSGPGPKLEEMRRGLAEDSRDYPLPNQADIAEYTTPYLGEPYEPKSRVGRMLHTAGSLLTGGGIRHLGRDILYPAIGSEVGGEIGEKIAGPEGAAIGTVAGGGGSSIGTEGFKRMLMRPAGELRQGHLNTLQREGVTSLTGGQALGSEGLKYFETGPFANKAGNVTEQQLREYTRAALKKAGITGDIADDVLMSREQAAFGQRYDDLIDANNGVKMDDLAEQSLTAHGGRYERLKGDSRGAVGHYFQRITEAARLNGGTIPPDVWKTIRGDMAADISASSDPELKATLRGFQDTMRESLERNGQGTIAADAAVLNRQYRNFKIIEKALVGGGENTSYGLVTPEKLGQAVRAFDTDASYTQNRGDFDPLVKAGTILKPLPNTGSGGRGLAGAVTTGMLSGGGLMLSGQPLAGAGVMATAAAAPVANSVLSSALTSRPVRTSIVNRASGNAPELFNPMTMPPLLGEASQQMPVPVEPPGPEEPEDHSMLLDSDVMPVPVDPRLVDPRDVLRRRGLSYG